MINEAKRLQKLAGLNEIKVNAPTNIFTAYDLGGDEDDMTYEIKYIYLPDNGYLGNDGGNEIILDFCFECEEDEEQKFLQLKNDLKKHRIPYKSEVDDDVYGWIYVNKKYFNIIRK